MSNRELTDEEAKVAKVYCHVCWGAGITAAGSCLNPNCEDGFESLYDFEIAVRSTGKT